LSEGGEPYSLGKSSLNKDIPVFSTPSIDLNRVRLEDEVNDKDSAIPYRFGIEHKVAITMKNAGKWETLANGDRLWRMSIQAPDAKSINLVYNDFYLPIGSQLYLNNEGYEQILGAFTSKNNKKDRSFATALVYGEKTYIEYYEPSTVIGQGRIAINMVVHGYRSIFDKSNAQLGNSGNCNIDTECPEGDLWRDEIKAAGKTIAGGGLCSGTLVGNVTGDQTPYFLTANHCGFANTVVVYWRFERPNCGSGTPDDTQTTSGAILRADVDGNPGGTIRQSDHLLMELTENPADNFDVYFAGWDASGNTPQSVTGIHHPAGDAKKISMENDVLTSTAYSNNVVNANGTHWRVIDWDSGTTEGGSSGSAIFDDVTKRLVGMLSGGGAACVNDLSDWYGKFSFAWTNNGTTDPSERLMDWLDTNSTGVLAIDGYGLSDIILGSTVSSVNVCGTELNYDFDLELVPGFSGNVTFSASGLPTGSTSSFDVNPATMSGTYTISTTGLASAAPGTYTVTINATDGMTSFDLDFELVVDDAITAAPTLTSPADGSSGESINPIFTWTVVSGVSNYLIEVATDAAFSNVVDTESPTTNTYLGIPLNTFTQYYWRVQAENSCGTGPFSTVFEFETGNNVCLTYSSTDTPITLPVFGTPTRQSTIIITDPGSITELQNLNLNIEHSWISDLTVTLTHMESGTRATLFASPCDDEDDIIGDFNDTGGTLPSPPTGGTYAPQDPFSTFIGESIAGTWILTIADGANQDGGSLLSWNLELCGNIMDDCPPNYQLTGTQLDDKIYETDGTIESDQKIDSDAEVYYDSGISILLQENFETTEGVIFHAFIDGCM